jgi:hypothetical protein
MENKEKLNWKKLKDYRCPKERCGAILKEFETELIHNHECTACIFKISHEKLELIVKGG